MKKLLICGSRDPKYDYGFFGTHLYMRYGDEIKENSLMIIEGCCPNSADEFAEIFARESHLELEHHPAIKGNYLERDREMVNNCDEVIVFWDGISRGTKYTINYAKRKGKRVDIIKI